MFDEASIRDLMREGRYAEAREAVISRVRGLPCDDAAVSLLLEVERKSLEAERRKRDNDGDDTFSGMLGRGDRRRMRGKLNLVTGCVFFAVGLWWIVQGLMLGPRGTFPVRNKTGQMRDVNRTEAVATGALLVGISGIGFAVYAWTHREDATS
jgi:hypothetical protein